MGVSDRLQLIFAQHIRQRSLKLHADAWPAMKGWELEGRDLAEYRLVCGGIDFKPPLRFEITGILPKAYDRMNTLVPSAMNVPFESVTFRFTSRIFRGKIGSRRNVSRTTASRYTSHSTSSILGTYSGSSNKRGTQSGAHRETVRLYPGSCLA